MDELKIIQDMQQVMEQMKQDDIEENPASEYELFSCSCCSLDKPKAGSIMYSMDIILCNDCALLAETDFALNKIKDINEFMENTEDKRLANLCEYIKQEKSRENN